MTTTSRSDQRARRDAGVEHPTEAVYVISVAARLVGMHPQTLRNY